MDYKTYLNSGDVTMWDNVFQNQWITIIEGIYYKNDLSEF